MRLALAAAALLASPVLARPAPVTIARDEGGIAHVHGRTDADAAQGMIYAQAEGDFPRIEQDYLVSLARASPGATVAKPASPC